jgi:ABC-type sugar transport system ATPase subunit
MTSPNELNARSNENATAIVPVAAGPICLWKRRLPPTSFLLSIKMADLSVRPEHLSIGDGNGQSSFDAAVEVIEQLGSEIILETRVGDARMTVARVDPQAALIVGEKIPLSVQPGRLHFFDPISDAAIR